jgi:hypothetical protein
MKKLQLDTPSNEMIQVHQPRARFKQVMQIRMSLEKLRIQLPLAQLHLNEIQQFLRVVVRQLR